MTRILWGAFLAFLLLVQGTAVSAEALLVWYVHGMIVSDEGHDQALEKLARLFPDAKKIELIQWDAPPVTNKMTVGVNWNDSVPIADRFASELVQRIAELPEQEQSRLILTGHSLGARIVIKTAAQCRERGIKLRQLILAGAAIDNDDPAIASAISASQTTVLNLINPEDYALALYRTAQKKYALGTGYLYDQDPKIFREVVLENTKSHFSYDYFGRLLEGLTEFGTLDYDGIIVPQGSYQYKFLTTGGVLHDYKVLDSCRGWQLQQHRLDGHCRIIDPQKIRRASGLRQQMSYAFDKVRTQLDRKADEAEIPPLSIEVPQDSENMPQPTMGGYVWWRELDSESGWRLQQNVIDRHCRILDPSSIRRAHGCEEMMRYSFNRVKEQLTQTPYPD